MFLIIALFSPPGSAEPLWSLFIGRNQQAEQHTCTIVHNMVTSLFLEGYFNEKSDDFAHLGHKLYKTNMQTIVSPCYYTRTHALTQQAAIASANLSALLHINSPSSNELSHSFSDSLNESEDGSRLTIKTLKRMT